MSPTRSRALAPLLVAVVLVGGPLAGCSLTSDDEPAAQTTTSASPEPSESDSASATESATPSESASGSATPTGTPSPSLTPDAALLTASEMPPLNDSSPWRLRSTGPIGSRPFGLCQKFDVLSVGAEQAVERRFTAVGGGRAAQEIATFPDAATAARATKVLQSWHKTCAARASGTSVNVRPMTSVPVTQGQGWWYLVSRVQGGQGLFHAFGVAAVGTRMSLLTMDHPGQDHNYPPGQDPMQLAVKAAAGKLG